MRRSVTCLPVIFSLILAACTSRSVDPGHRFDVETIDGVVTATSNAIPRYAEPLFSFEEVLRLKEDPEIEESLLIRPVSFVQGDDDFFYVMDMRNNHVTVFDREGNFSRIIGRSGEGPGEFQGVGHVYVNQGVVQVFDNRSNRITRFRSDGTLIDVTSLNQIAHDLHLNFLASARLTDDDEIVLESQQNEMTGEFTLVHRIVAVLNPDREVTWQMSTPQHMLQTWGVIRGVRALGVPIPHATLPSIDFEPAWGILISPGDVPELLLYRLDGTLLRRIRFEIEARPVTAEDRAAILDSYDERIAAASAQSAETLKSMKEATYFPEQWPYWGGAGVDEYGYIWLSVSEPESEREAAGGGGLSMVLSPEGEYLGNTRLPQRGGIHRGRIMAITSNPETGENHLIVYRIRSEVAGFSYP